MEESWQKWSNVARSLEAVGQALQEMKAAKVAELKASELYERAA